MTMRARRARWLRLVAVVLAFGLIAAACGGGGDDGGTETTGTDDGTTSTAAPSGGDEGDALNQAQAESEAAQSSEEEVLVEENAEPVTGGTLRIGLEAETDGLNPTVNRFAVSALQMGNAVFETIAAWDENGFATPYLAESWDVSDDAMTIQIKLRPGITFHDGVPLNADAVIRNVQAQLADPLISLAVKPALNLDNPIEKVDDLTVQINLAKPNAQFPAALTGQLGMVASPAWLDAAADDPSLNQEPVGTGPFKFDSRQQDQVTRFVRNEDWWQGEVYLEAVEFYPITDTQIAAQQLIAGDLEGMGTTNTFAIESLRDEGDSLIRVEDDLGEESFAMLNTAQPPFDDIRARQALTYATPRENYIEFIGIGILRPADSMFAPELIWNNPDVVQEGDQPEKAAPLVEAYCADNPDNCTDGKIDIELQYSGPSVVQDNVADILEEGWGPYFNVTREVLLQDDHITQVALGQFNVVTWRQFGAPDPTNDRVWLACDSINVLSLNWPRLCDPEREQLLDEQRAITDIDRRVEIWKELQQKIHDDYTYIFFTHTLWVNAFQPSVHNVCGAESPDGVPLLCTVNGRHWVHQIWLDG